jgi:hypothetical protein
LVRRSGLGAGSPRGGAHKKEIVIRSSSKLSARAPVRVAGIVVCLLAASAVGVILRSIPASHAGIPDATDAHANDPQSLSAVSRPTINRRSGASCSECGVVASIREIERPEGPGGQETLGVKVAARVSGGAIVAGPTTRTSYEITVRFRDGSTVVFNEAGPRTWRLGARVIMIGHSLASN